MTLYKTDVRGIAQDHNMTEEQAQNALEFAVALMKKALENVQNEAPQAKGTIEDMETTLYHLAMRQDDIDFLM